MKKIKENKIRKIVKDNYDTIAKDFDSSRKKYIWPELNKLSEEITDNDKVLDAGCGNGRLLEVFKNKKIEYLGFDNSNELLKFAKINYPNYDFKYLDIFNANQIKDDYYDFVFLVAVIIHIPGKENRIRLIKELGKKLKKDGKIFISAWNILDEKKYKKIILKNKLRNIFSFNGLEKNDIFFPWKNNKGENISERYYYAFTKKELLKLGNKTGLKVENYYKDEHNFWLILKK